MLQVKAFPIWTNLVNEVDRVHYNRVNMVKWF